MPLPGTVTDRALPLGRQVGGVLPARAEIVVDGPLPGGFLDHPGVRAEIERRTGARLPRTERGGREILLLPGVLERHALVTGSTGAGKTYFVLHLVLALLGRWSIVLIDPKGDLSARLLSCLSALADPPPLTLADPKRGLLPGINPFLESGPVHQIVSQLVAILERLFSSSWGPRLSNLLSAVFWVGAVHRLSLVEVVRMLMDEPYLSALLQVGVPGAPAAYADVRVFLQQEYLSWSTSTRREAAAAVLNKLYEFLRPPALQVMLTSLRNTLSLASLWQRPQVLIVALDRQALGVPGTRLLSAWLTSRLYAAAFSQPGRVPVLLVLDELPMYAKLVGETLDEAVAVARSLGLHLVCVAQHLDQLSAPLRQSLLANAGLITCLRSGREDARLAAPSLAAGTPELLVRAHLSAEPWPRRGAPPVSVRRYRIEDPQGLPLRVSPELWQGIEQESLCSPDPLSPLARLQSRLRRSGFYLRPDGSGEPIELGRFVAALPRSSYWLEGPQLVLVVAYPRLRLSEVERFGEAEAARSWVRALEQMPERHAALRLLGVPQGIVRLPDVLVPAPNPKRLKALLTRARSAGGLSPDEIRSLRGQREEEIRRIRSGEDRLGQDHPGNRDVPPDVDSRPEPPGRDETERLDGSHSQTEASDDPSLF